MDESLDSYSVSHRWANQEWHYCANQSSHHWVPRVPFESFEGCPPSPTHDAPVAESAALEKSTNAPAEESAHKSFHGTYPQYGASAMLSPVDGVLMAESSRLSHDTEDPGDEVRRSRGDPPQTHDGKYYCSFSPECADQYFDRKCEWRQVVVHYPARSKSSC